MITIIIIGVSKIIQILTVKSDNKRAFVNINVKSNELNKMISCKIDTGADGNLMALEVYKGLVPTARCSKGIPACLKPSNTKISAYGST